MNDDENKGLKVEMEKGAISTYKTIGVKYDETWLGEFFNNIREWLIHNLIYTDVFNLQSKKSMGKLSFSMSLNPTWHLCQMHFKKCCFMLKI